VRAILDNIIRFSSKSKTLTHLARPRKNWPRLARKVCSSEERGQQALKSTVDFWRKIDCCGIFFWEVDSRWILFLKVDEPLSTVGQVFFFNSTVATMTIGHVVDCWLWRNFLKILRPFCTNSSIFSPLKNAQQNPRKVDS
jgi:hypothetical protein